MNCWATDLIDDRAIIDVTSDRLGHQQLARELVNLIQSTKTPANIALYGRWGAGKTSIANLLRRELDEDRRTRFVRFDAFKWVEMPLRRHFLSQLAKELGIKDQRFSQGLYQKSERLELSLPPSWSTRAVLLLLALVLIGGMAISVSWTFDTTPTLLDRILKVLGATSLLSGVSAVLLALAGKTLPIRRTTNAPSSDEEFEGLFRDLVRMQRCSRLVVFIDELDRCSPEEVVETLETMKTFLEVENCVFIVAADRRVLQQALSKRVRQATPEPDEEPYYSTGGEYLDKMFHYQLEIPALRPYRLTAMALDLVRDHGGVWDKVDRAQVVSVLIPTHVTSPRRAKTLLNNFILAFRLAERRSEEGSLDRDVVGRASELAKLVALRTEFPMFAAHLELDHQLTEWIPKLRTEWVPMLLESEDEEVEEPDWPGRMSAKARTLAKSYACSELPVDKHLSKSIEQTGTGWVSGSVSNGSSVGGAVSGRERQLGSGVAEGLRVQGEQLVSYLMKTRSVPGPRQDLIFFESPGVAYGLQPSFAYELESLAVDGLSGDVVEALEELDEAGWVSSIRMLAHRARHAAVGVEGANAVHCLLAALGQASTARLMRVADEGADAVAAHQRDYMLLPEDLRGALRLGLASSRNMGKELVKTVLGRKEALSLDDLGMEVLRAYPEVCPIDRRRAKEIVLRRLSAPNTAREAWEVIASFEAETRTVALEEVGVEFMESLENMAEEPGIDGETALRILGIASDTFSARGFWGDWEALMSFALEVEATPSRLEVYSLLEERGQVTTGALARGIVAVTKERNPKEWAAWLRPLVNQNYMKEIEPRLMAGLVEALERHVGPETHVGRDVFQEAAEAVRKLVDSGAKVERDAVGDFVAEALQSLPIAPGTISKEDEVLYRAKCLLEENLVGRSDLDEAIANRISGYLALPPSQPQLTNTDVKSRLGNFCEVWARWLAEESGMEDVDEVLRSFASCQWLESHKVSIASLRVAAAARASGKCAELLPEPEAVRQLALDHGFGSNCSDQARAAISDWLRYLDPEVGEAWSVLEVFAYRMVPSGLRRALREYAGQLDEEERWELLLPSLRSALERVPARGFLEAGGLKECEEERVGEFLVKLYSGATNNDERNGVLDLCVAAEMRDAGVRRRLVEKIYLPAIEMNKGSLDNMLAHAELLEDPPHGTKLRIREALAKGLRAYPDLRRRYARRLGRMDLLERRGIFRRFFGSE